MKLLKITSQTRRDFTGIMQCEFCQSQWENKEGYDDRYYHDEVIPKMVCKNCGKSTVSEGGKIKATPTKYPDGLLL